MLPLLPLLLLGAPALSLPLDDTEVVTPLRLDPDINGRAYFRRGPAEPPRGGQAVVFQLSAFGEDFYLHLTPDAHFIAPAFAAHYLGAAGRPGPALRHCFYSGDVNADRESFAALSLCGGLRGAFGYRGAEYIISPLAAGAAGGEHRLQRRSPGRPVGVGASRCAVGSGLTPGVLQALDKYRGRGGGKGGRAKRFASVPRYVETLVVADESMVKFHGDDLQHYLLTLMATAARLYKHPSIRNPIQISVVKFLLIGQDDKGPKVTGNAALTLRNFCASSHLQRTLVADPPFPMDPYGAGEVWTKPPLLSCGQGWTSGAGRGLSEAKGCADAGCPYRQNPAAPSPGSWQELQRLWHREQPP